MVKCRSCEADSEFLRRKERPNYELDTRAIRIVDLFSGCGGLTLGLAEAARELGRSVEIPLVIDNDAIAIDVFRDNFPDATAEQQTVESVFDGDLGARPTEAERSMLERVGEVDILAGGPPCQGHSDLNNHTRRRDPRNALYERMGRAAEILRPRLVVVENVPAVMKDADGVVGVTRAALEAAGYSVAHEVINLSTLGIPQKRRRHLLVAAPKESIDPASLLAELGPACASHAVRTVRWAIVDLEDLENEEAFDCASAPSADNTARMKWLFEHGEYDLPNYERPNCHQNEDHTYKSMYGRLRWDEPAQTVTTGFGSMGQGRYVHPSRQRVITPHEAARLQSFPDFFRFSATGSRQAWARMIGNAVPPLLARAIGYAALPYLLAETAEEVA